MFLQAVHLSSLSEYWIGVAVSAYRLELWDECRKSLGNASVLDNDSAELWAYMSLLYIKTAGLKKRDDILRSLTYAVHQCSLSNWPLLVEICSELLRLTCCDMEILNTVEALATLAYQHDERTDTKKIITKAAIEAKRAGTLGR
eukprot:Platyproteum_vivax@DN16176_c0_g1_i1.p2